MKNVAVVILNWNGENFLRQFLQNVVDCSFEDADLFVVDNGSTDGSLPFLNSFANVNTIVLDKNYGFASGYNKALNTLVNNYEYYILLNSDVEVTECWISNMIVFMQQNPSFAACQPKLLSFYDKDSFEYAGGAGGFIDVLGYPFCKGRIFNTIEKDYHQYDTEPFEVFWATGACLCIRSRLFHELNGFDDDFFAHQEEIDLCWRLKNRGYKIACCTNSVVYHVGGGSLPKSSPFKTYLNIRNNLVMIYKNYYSHVLLILALRLLLDYISAVKFLFDNGYKEFLSVFKAHFYFLKRLKQIKVKRRLEKKVKTDMIYNKSIVYAYFIKKKHYFYELDKQNFRAKL